ncbi:hypothetical protein BH10BAC1_BH10BAC1_12200 [soil metagenome]
MNNLLKKITLSIAMLIASVSGFAQGNAPVEMATGLYQSGKIYVVVIVIAIIFVGIVGYLIMLDRKISILEKESN